MTRQIVTRDNQLRDHLEYLLAHDRWFSDAWKSWDRGRRKHFLAIASTLDTLTRDSRLQNDFAAITKSLRKMFLLVPERGMLESKLEMSRWISFASDSAAKEEVYNAGLEYFQRAFVITEGQRQSYLHLYGGLKDVDHLHTVPKNKKEGASPISEKLGDLWDVVRFRAVTASPIDVQCLALRIWELNLDDLIKCRNYYVNPRPSARWYTHPYRAIHLQVPILEHMVELQIMTHVFEVLSFLDHAVLFKQRLDPIDDAHRRWLRRMQAAAVMLEGRLSLVSGGAAEFVARAHGLGPIK